MRDLGAEWVSLDVLTTNSPARMLYERLGFTDVQTRMAVPLATLEQRAGGGAPPEPSLAVVHVQTDDQAAIASAVERFVPRLYRSAATAVSAPHNGWVSVSDAAWDAEPQLARQLAQELSVVTGGVVVELALEHERFVRLAAFERGSLLDEYLSVPDAYGELAPGRCDRAAGEPDGARPPDRRRAGRGSARWRVPRRRRPSCRRRPSWPRSWQTCWASPRRGRSRRSPETPAPASSSTEPPRRSRDTSAQPLNPRLAPSGRPWRRCRSRTGTAVAVSPRRCHDTSARVRGRCLAPFEAACGHVRGDGGRASERAW